MPTKTVLAVGDTHFPFADPRALARVIESIDMIRPDVVIQMGDLFDMYSWSKFPRTHRLMTPHEEVRRGREHAERFWEKVRKASPKSKRIQLTGNHDVRPYKRLMETAPEMEALLSIRGVFEFSGVETEHDEGEVILGGVCYMHGFRKHGDHVRHNRMSTVCGHLHVGGVVYTRLGDKVLWELNAGHVGDPLSEPMSYGNQRRFATWTHGFGLVDFRGPRFVHT